MFHVRNRNECFLFNYLHVLLLSEVGLPLEYHLPHLRLLHHLAKHVGVVADHGLEMRLMVLVLEMIFADRLQHSHRMGLVPLLQRVEVLHTHTSNIISLFLILSECQPIWPSAKGVLLASPGPTTWQPLPSS